VENVEDLRTLTELQCDMAQGFLFARPMPVGKFIEHLSGLPIRESSHAQDHFRAEQPLLTKSA
jgi:EAL domain-containing protein (putative c-di-GMP-specific phosphodiesterase class I)